jgi:hypothetical protein
MIRASSVAARWRVAALLLFLPGWAAGQSSVATITSPADGATDIDASVPAQITWTSVADAEAYYLYVGTSAGANDVYDGGETQATAALVRLRPSTTYHARIWTKKSSGWYYSDSSFQTDAGIARLTFPADQAINIEPSIPVQFRWTSVTTAAAYYLYVGTSPGAKDAYESYETQAVSAWVTLAPATTYYVRLWTRKASGWRYSDSSFQTGTGIARLISPADQSTGVDPSGPVQFTWSSVSDALAYYLYVGTSVGAKDVYNSYEIQALGAAVTLAPLTTYYVRLWTKKASGWRYSDSSFQTGTGIARLTVPSDGATDVDPLTIFQWTGVPGAERYYLTIGTSPGGADVFDSWEIQPGVTNLRPWGLFSDGKYFARLWTKVSGTWYFRDSTFQTAPPGLPPAPADFYSTIENSTAQVRGMTIGLSNAPVPGTLLHAQVMQRGISIYADCVDFSAVLAGLLRDNNITARIRTTTFNGTTYEGHTMVEYYDPFLGKWAIADATFGLLYFDPATQQGQSVEDINAHVLSFDFDAVKFKFVTQQGDYWLRSYYMDPLSLYLNPLATAPDAQLFPVQNDPRPYLTSQGQLQIEGKAGVYILEFSDTSESAVISDLGSDLTLAPVAPGLWSKAVLLQSGWSFVSVAPSTKFYTFPVFWTNDATLTNPVDQAQDVDPALPVEFRWTEIFGARSYRLQVGTSAGANDVFDSGDVSGTRVYVALQERMQYFARLWTDKGAQSYFRDTSFTTMPTIARLISPPPGAVDVDASEPVEFEWSEVPGAQTYYLYVGSRPGEKDVFDSRQTSATTAVVTLQPQNVYYIRLWTLVSGFWYFVDAKIQTQ